MLRLENRMTFKRRLFPIMRRFSWSKPFADKIQGMPSDFGYSDAMAISEVFGIEFESGAELGSCELG